MQVTFSTLLKGAKVLKSAGTVSDKFNSLAWNYTKPRHKFRLFVDQNLIDFLLLQTPC